MWRSGLRRSGYIAERVVRSCARKMRKYGFCREEAHRNSFNQLLLQIIVNC